MMYLLLGGVLALSHLASAETNLKPITKEALTIDSYRIVDTTHLYPQPNFYDQYMDCSAGMQDNGLGSLRQGVQNSSSTVATDLPVILPTTPGTGGSIGGGIGTPIGTDPGVITIDPVNGGGNSGTGTGVGGIGIGGGGYPYDPGYGTTDPGITLDKIVNIGNLVWQIVDMGRPSAHIQTYRAHAMPKGIVCWTDLENWQLPISKVFSVEYKNKLGMVVAVYSYRISFVYGGNVDGVGKYIANLTVTPVDMRVSWGFNFSSQVQIPSTFNLGKKADPLAGMQVFVFWSIGNALKVEQRSSLFNVTGDGRVQLTESR